MAEPAQDSAAGPGPDDPARHKHDPRVPGWMNVQRAFIANAGVVGAQAEVVAEAAAQVAARPEHADAIRALNRASSIQEQARDELAELGEIGRRWVVDDAVLAETWDRGYARGAADCKAARHRMRVVGDG